MLKTIVFDFDGVILESLDIKTRAFRELFKSYPEHLDRIEKLHLDKAGVSRFEKFRIIYQDYLGQPIDDDELERLGDEFSRFVYKEILTCPFVPGAHQFLQARAKQYQLFVASGTPQEEIRDIVKRRKLDQFFCGVYGSPRCKREILEGILAENSLQPVEIVFIGDAISDYWGALGASVPFIGRVPQGESHPFQESGVIAIVTDLGHLEKVWGSITESLSQRAGSRFDKG